MGTPDNASTTGTAPAPASSASSSSSGSALGSLERAAASSPAAPGAEGASAPPSPVSSPPAAATTAPPGTSETPTRGPIPYDRHEAALRNARQELTEKLGWAEGLTRDETLEAIQLVSRLRQDPRSFLQQLTQELGQGEGEDELVDPDPDLQSEDGKLRAFSEKAMRQLLANQEKRISRRFLSEVKPALDFAEQGREQQRLSQIVSEAQATAHEVMQAASKLPYFEENRQHILQELQQIPVETRRRVGSPAALYMAYTKVLSDEVLPNLASRTESDVIKGFQKAAHATNGNVHPQRGAATPSQPIRDGDVDGLARRMEELASKMG